eukprot:Rmarinus@m.4880
MGGMGGMGTTTSLFGSTPTKPAFSSSLTMSTPQPALGSTPSLFQQTQAPGLQTQPLPNPADLIKEPYDGANAIWSALASETSSPLVSEKKPPSELQQTTRMTPRSAAKLLPRGYIRPQQGTCLDAGLLTGPASKQLLSPDAFVSRGSLKKLVVEQEPDANGPPVPLSEVICGSRPSPETPLRHAPTVPSASPAASTSAAAAASTGSRTPSQLRRASVPSPLTPDRSRESEPLTPRSNGVHGAASTPLSSVGASEHPSPGEKQGSLTSSTGDGDDGTSASVVQRPKPVRRPGVYTPVAGSKSAGHDSQFKSYSDFWAEHAIPRFSPEKDGYYTLPSYEEMQRMSLAELAEVPNFTVGRTGYGSIIFRSPTDVRSLSLDDVVIFEKKEVIVYPEDVFGPEDKPPVGQGLNKVADVSLEQCFCLDKTTKTQTKDPKRIANYIARLKRKSEDMDAEFIDYDSVRGVWTFRVPHFSRYALDDDDEDDEDDGPLAPAPGTGTGKPGQVRVQVHVKSSDFRDAHSHPSAPTSASKSASRPGPTSRIHAPSDSELSEGEDEGEEPGVGRSLASGGWAKQDAAATAPLGRRTDMQAVSTGMDIAESAEGGGPIPGAPGSAWAVVPQGYHKGVEEEEVSEPLLKRPMSYHLGLRPQHVEFTKAVMSHGDGVDPGLSVPDWQFNAEEAERGLYEVDMDSTDEALQQSMSPEQEHSQPRRRRIREEDIPAHPAKPEPLEPLATSEESVSCGHEHITDMCLFMGRSFRVGWGLGCGSQLRLYTPSVSVGSNAEGGPIARPVAVHAHAVLPAKMDEDPELIRSRYLPLMDSFYRNCVEDDEDSEGMGRDDGSSGTRSDESRRLPQHILPSENLVATINDIREVAMTIADDSAAAADAGVDPLSALADSHAALVWGLMEALFGGESNFVNKRVQASYRWDTFSRWLQDAVMDDAQAASEDSADRLDSLYHLLSGHCLADAAKVATSFNDFRLAVLLSQAGSARARAAEDMRAQLEEWEASGVAGHMEERRLALYRLLSGDPTCAPEMDWKRALGLRLWYTPRSDEPNTADDLSPLASTLAQYSEDLDLHQECGNGRNQAPLPVPPYLESEPVYRGSEERGGSPPEDMLFQLVRLSCDRTASLSLALRTSGTTAYALDIRLCWMVYRVLISLGLPKLPREAELTMQFASQLESIGLWEWAIFVAMQVPAPCAGDSDAASDMGSGLDPDEPCPSPAEAAVREMLCRHVGGDSFLGDRSEDFLVHQLKVPAAWVSEAKAYRAGYEGRVSAQIRHLLACDMFDEAHKLYVQKVAPLLMLNGRYSEIVRQLSPLEKRKEEVHTWARKGGLFLEFARFCQQAATAKDIQLRDGLIGFQDAALSSAAADLGHKAADLATRISAAYNMDENLSPCLRACLTRMSDRVHEAEKYLNCTFRGKGVPPTPRPTHSPAPLPLARGRNLRQDPFGGPVMNKGRHQQQEHNHEGGDEMVLRSSMGMAEVAEEVREAATMACVDTSRLSIGSMYLSTLWRMRS